MKINTTLKRAVSVDEMYKIKFDSMDFTGEFERLIGTPEKAGSWIMWGTPGQGKTRFALQLCKYLATFARVGYNSLEEGKKLSFQRAIIQTNMKAVNKKFVILSESIDELKARLKRPKSPRIIVIDSVQYANMSKKSYQSLINDFPKVLFIFISHAEGKKPHGSLAKYTIYHHSDVKIRVEGYKAFAISRFGGGEPYTIWQHGAERYWGMEEQ